MKKVLPVIFSVIDVVSAIAKVLKKKKEKNCKSKTVNDGDTITTDTELQN
jgi:hypothetical protein